MNDFQKFLLREMQKYERKVGRHATWDEFAEYIHIKRPTLSRWVNNGIKPGLENALLISDVLGVEVFQYLDHEVDGLIAYIIYNWNSLNSDQKLAVREHVAEYIVEKHGEKDQPGTTGADAE